MITLADIPSQRLPGYITTNGIIGLRLDRLPNGRTVAAEVRRDELGELVHPYLDLAESPTIIVRALAERCGLPILPGTAASQAEIAAWRARDHRAFVNAEETANKRPQEKGGEE